MHAAGTRLARVAHEALHGERLEWLQIPDSVGSTLTTSLLGAPMSHQCRCYSVQQLLAKLSMPRRAFLQLKNAGRLPFLEECRPSVGRSIRYRAEPIDRYLANGWAACRQHSRKIE